MPDNGCAKNAVDGVSASRPFRFIGYSAIVCIFIAVTFARNIAWHDPAGFWQDVVDKSPRNARALNNLCGYLYATKRQFDQALVYCLQAARLQPDDYETHLNLWQIYKVKGIQAEAKKEYLLSTKVLNKTRDADSAVAEYLIEKGWLAEASGMLEKAIARDPANADNYYELGAVLEKNGKTASAIAQYRKYLGAAEKHDARIKTIQRKILLLEKEQ